MPRRKQSAPARVVAAAAARAPRADDDDVIVIDAGTDEEKEARVDARRKRAKTTTTLFSRTLKRRDSAPTDVAELGRCAVCVRAVCVDGSAGTSSRGARRAVETTVAKGARAGERRATFRRVEDETLTTTMDDGDTGKYGIPCAVEFVFEDDETQTYGIAIGDDGVAFMELFVKFETRVDAWLTSDGASLVVGLTSGAFACTTSDAELRILLKTDPGAFTGMANFYTMVARTYDALSGEFLKRRDAYARRIAGGGGAVTAAATPSDALDLSAIFDAVRPDAKLCPTLECEFPELLPSPRAYQKQAAAWMLARERASNAPAGALAAKRGVLGDQKVHRALHPLWRELPGGGAYINVFNGMLSTTRFEIDEDYEDVRGGILADEMGLGKTVEIIMLVLANRRVVKEKCDEDRAVKDEDVFEIARETPETPIVMPTTSPATEASATESTISSLAATVSIAVTAVVKAETMNDDDVQIIESAAATPVNEEPVEDFRISCVCGAREEDPKYNGVWLGCDKCGVWQHARCVLKLTKPREIELQKMSDKKRDEVLGEFLCGKCMAEYAGETYDGPCGATLVVCPTPIFEQWNTELTRHVRAGTLKIIRYEGQSRECGSGGLTKDVFGTKQLAEADIVLTTYDTLRSEINIDISDGVGRAYAERARRYERKYEIVPTPLTRLNWWRVVLDEAQMVESTVSIAAMMVRRLPAVHRWAVTGTPISRSLGDIFGLLTFLCVRPFEHDGYWWSRLVEGPYNFGDVNAKQYLHKLLKGLMWRNSREDMRDQLEIPPQGEIVTWLASSAVERHWYKTQFRECHNTASEVLAHKDFVDIDENKPLATKDARRLMGPLLRLRQACDHPQAGSHGLAGGILRSGANVLTMCEITDKLIEKARVEAEEAQRLVAFALNAIGGLAWCENDLTSAINAYREVIQIEATGKESRIRLDAMQLLHAKYNLSEALKRVKVEPALLAAPIARTVRDDELEGDVRSLRDKYISERAGDLSRAELEFEDVHSSVNLLLRKYESKKDVVDVSDSTWWLDIMHHIEKSPGNMQAQLLQRIHSQYDGRWQGQQIAFEDWYGLRLQILSDLQKIDTSRKALLDRMEELKEIVASASPERVREVGMCETCRAGTDFATPGILCVFCHTKPLFEIYERHVMGTQTLSTARMNGELDPAEQRRKDEGLPTHSRFGRKIGGEKEETNRAGASAAESVLQMLLSVLSARRADIVPDADEKETIMHRAKSHLSALEIMRKEFYKASALFVQQREKMAARDELEMSTMRIRVRAQYEMPTFGKPDPVPFALQSVVIHQYEVELLKSKYTHEKASYDVDMSKAVSQLRYLESLRKTTGPKDGEEIKATSLECPVCLGEIAVTDDVSAPDVCVYPCGHHTCVQCAAALIKRAHAIAPPLQFARNEGLHSRYLKCVTCRSLAKISDLNYVATVKANDLHQMTDFVRKSDGDHLTTMLGAPDEHYSGESKLQVIGSWGTKIEAIVRRVKWLASRDARVKILVFSEFEDVLDVVQRAISHNSISFERATTGHKLNSSLQNFKTRASVRVLLLPLKRAAHGLNLTEAQHVILVEPVLDPGLEAQAIKRVDRIGQLKPTCVHRFMIRQTIEETVYTLARQRVDELSDIASDLSLSKRDEATAGLSLADIRRLLKMTSRERT